MAHGSAAAAGQIKIRTVAETDGVSQIGGHRPGRHIPLSPLRNRHDHYQRQVPASKIVMLFSAGCAAGFPQDG